MKVSKGLLLLKMTPVDNGRKSPPMILHYMVSRAKLFFMKKKKNEKWSKRKHCIWISVHVHSEAILISMVLPVRERKLEDCIISFGALGWCVLSVISVDSAGSFEMVSAIVSRGSKKYKENLRFHFLVAYSESHSR